MKERDKMQTTGNYGLKKPEGNDVVNIDDLNYNTDIIDVQLKVNADNLTNHSTSKQTHGASGSYYIAKTTRSDQFPSWADIPDKPSSFNPSAHTHTKANITDFAHKSTHATGGSDALTPADIGAETPSGAQAKVDTHANNTAAHSATSAATANRIIMRDANGRAKVANPSAYDDIANLGTVSYLVDEHANDTSNPHAVNKWQIGLSNVDNMSASQIRSASNLPLVAHVSSTAPSSPTNGQLWYDTTIHMIKIYANGNWISGGGNMIYKPSNTARYSKSAEVTATGLSTGQAYLYGVFTPLYNGMIKLKGELKSSTTSHVNFNVYALRYQVDNNNNIIVPIRMCPSNFKFYSLPLGTITSTSNFTGNMDSIANSSANTTSYTAFDLDVNVYAGYPLVFMLLPGTGATPSIRNFQICYDTSMQDVSIL